MSLRMHFQTPDGEYRAVDLSSIPGDGLVVGRDRSVAGLVIPDQQVSRGHCVIRHEEGGLMIEDLGSRNGTWLNGQKIQKRILQRGDQILLGGTRIRVAAGTGSDELAYALLGKSLAGFDFQEVMGQGSYGTVYRGVQGALSRPVAIKVLDPVHAADPARVEAFLMEARNAGRLNHPNLVQVHDVVQAEGHHFIVMELMTGGAMSDRLRIDGPIDPDTARSIIIDIGHALAYAESQRLVHRDVKPDNILVNDEGVHKLADLGIAAPIDADGMAQQERAFGSAHYVAPEQARGGAIDGRADIYGLGASLFHLIIGRPMFDGTSREIVSAHIHNAAPDIASLRKEFPRELTALVQQMLSKDPAQRPATGNEIAVRAQALGTQALSGGTTPGRKAAPRRRRARRRRRR